MISICPTCRCLPVLEHDHRTHPGPGERVIGDDGLQRGVGLRRVNMTTRTRRSGTGIGLKLNGP